MSYPSTNVAEIQPAGVPFTPEAEMSGQAQPLQPAVLVSTQQQGDAEPPDMEGDNIRDPTLEDEAATSQREVTKEDRGEKMLEVEEVRSVRAVVGGEGTGGDDGEQESQGLKTTMDKAEEKPNQNSNALVDELTARIEALETDCDELRLELQGRDKSCCKFAYIAVGADPPSSTEHFCNVGALEHYQQNYKPQDSKIFYILIKMVDAVEERDPDLSIEQMSYLDAWGERQLGLIHAADDANFAETPQEIDAASEQLRRLAESSVLDADGDEINPHVPLRAKLLLSILQLKATHGGGSSSSKSQEARRETAVLFTDEDKEALADEVDWVRDLADCIPWRWFRGRMSRDSGSAGRASPTGSGQEGVLVAPRSLEEEIAAAFDAEL